MGREVKSKSRFKIMHWLPEYLKWFFYCLATSWLKKNYEKETKNI